jgi:hypothetical protein
MCATARRSSTPCAIDFTDLFGGFVTVLGIAATDAAHTVHRYRGKPVFRETARYVFDMTDQTAILMNRDDGPRFCRPSDARYTLMLPGW